jgi:3-methyladenine DNA glycosylase AlkC
MITKIADIKPLLARGRAEPAAAFPELRRMAASTDWKVREVAATALVEIGKRHPQAVVAEAYRWADDPDHNVRRAASEGLRGVVKQDPDSVWPVLEILREDPHIYVRKSVANVLRNASARHPGAVLALCRRWATSATAHTRWIIRAGLQKLRTTHAEQVAAILTHYGR